MEKAMSQTSNMHVTGESDGCVLPTKGPNSEGQFSGEGLEGRRPTRENIGQTAAARTQNRIPGAPIGRNRQNEPTSAKRMDDSALWG